MKSCRNWIWNIQSATEMTDSDLILYNRKHALPDIFTVKTITSSLNDSNRLKTCYTLERITSLSFLLLHLLVAIQKLQPVSQKWHLCLYHNPTQKNLWLLLFLFLILFQDTKHQKGELKDIFFFWFTNESLCMQLWDHLKKKTTFSHSLTWTN